MCYTFVKNTLVDIDIKHINKITMFGNLKIQNCLHFTKNTIKKKLLFYHSYWCLFSV